MKQNIRSNEKIQMVSFCLGNEEFAINIMQVKEINRYVETMKIPKAADFIEGVIKLRNQVIPIISLRHRFKYQKREVNDDSRIIIVEIKDQTAGFVVDSVKEVMRVTTDAIDKAPDMFSSQASKYMSGVCKMDDRMIILLELDKIFSDNEIDMLKQAA